MGIKDSIFTFIVILIFGATGFFGHSQPSNSNVVTALSKGDATKIAEYFHSEEIDLELPNIADVFSKKDAKKYLDDFFKNYPPVSFETMHEGVSKNGKGQYLIGNLSTRNGKFRVTITFKNQLIQSMSFHMEDET